MRSSVRPPPRPTLSSSLLDALFDFETLPGRYPLSLREPRVLFDHGFAVLHLAAGHEFDGLILDSDQSAQAQRAARYFVRTALMRPGADHYTLLGLSRNFTSDMLRSHYRLLMRLTHPDFVGTSGTWPADAANRINLANDVLSSASRRGDYDRHLRADAGRQSGWNSAWAILPRPVPSRGTRYRAWGGAGLAAVAFAVAWQQWTASTQDTQVAALTPSVKGIAPVPTQASTNAADPKPASTRIVPPVVTAPTTPAMPATQKPAVLIVSSPSASQPSAVPAARPSPAVSGLTRPTALSESRVVAGVAPRPATSPATPVAMLAARQPLAMANVQPQPSAPVEASKMISSESVASISNRLTVADAQVAMGQLILAMQAGRGDALLRALERPLSQSEGAAELAQAYTYLIGTSRQVRVGSVQLRGVPQADQLAVDGVVQLLLQDQGSPPPVIELRLRAKFVQRGGIAAMTELDAGGSRP